MTTIVNGSYSSSAAARRTRRMAIALGVVMIIGGFIAIAFPFFSSLAVGMYVGIMLCIAGVAQAVWAFGHHRWSGITMNLIIAALWFAAGAYLLWRPLEGVFGLTILVAAAFVIEGIVKAMLALRLRPQAGWGWVMVNAVLALVLGVMLWWRLPSSALWALGTLAGINILFAGWTLLMLPGIVEGFQVRPQAG